MRNKKQLKIRRYWDIDPSQKPHSTKKGEKGYNRRLLRNLDKKGNKYEENYSS